MENDIENDKVDYNKVNHDRCFKRGLLITFEGIAATIFDSQVALHARQMRDQGIEFEIWTFQTRRRLYKPSLQRLDSSMKLARSSIRLFRGMFSYLPFSGFVNAVILLYYLIKEKPDVDFIHARADYAAHVCAFLTPFLKLPLIWDCRGDAEAEFALAYSPKNWLLQLAKRIYLWLIRWRTYHAATNSHRVIFVSKGLWKRMGKRVQHENIKVIPCGVSEEHFFFSETLRRESRERLGFDAHDRVLIYSGGMVKYQGFSEYIEMFWRFYQRGGRYKFLIATPYNEMAYTFLKRIPGESYKLISASFEEMNSLYNAADFGTLLRPYNRVNDVASPTKFGEYCLSGLPVIMNDTVQQANEYAKRFGNLISYYPNLILPDLIPVDNKVREIISKAASKVLSRTALVQRYLQVYTY